MLFIKNRKLELSILLFSSLYLNAVNTDPDKISFRENKGQVKDQNYNARPDVLFSGSFNGMDFHLKNNGISYQLKKATTNSFNILDEEKSKTPQSIDLYRIDINWLNINSKFTIKKEGSIRSVDNFYLNGSEILGVRSYKGIVFQNIYNGIDLHYYEKTGALKYDYIVSPYTDYKKIKFKIEGATEIFLDKSGALIISTPFGNIKEEAPIVFQSGKQLIAKWKVENNTVSFDVKSVDPSQVLIIDPAVRIWGTYYGGTSDDVLYGLKVDKNNNVFVCGYTWSNSLIATTGAYQTSSAGSEDVFLALFDTNGNRLWGTYFGGPLSDYGRCCSVDTLGNVYISGFTHSSTGIANPTAAQSIYGGGPYDAFLAKFNNSGIKQWGTYFGVNGDDESFSCAVDLAGNVILSGYTTSSVSLATTGSHQVSYGGNTDGFISKYNTNGTRLWSTYYGGNGSEFVYGCDVDKTGNVFFTGFCSPSTNTTAVVTAGSYQPVFGGSNDAILVKFNSAGVRQWATYYGGSGIDVAIKCCIDTTGNVYIAGSTASTLGIATSGAFQTTNGGGLDDFYLAKFNTAGVRLWATYYGSIGYEYAYGLSCDKDCNVFLSGSTDTGSPTLVTAGSHQVNFGGGNGDALLVKFDSSGVRQWGTYYGGPGAEGISATSNDALGNVYIGASSTTSTGISIAIPTAYQPTLSGSYDGYIAKISDCPSIVSSSSTPTLVCPGQSVILNGSGASSYTWSTASNSQSITVTPTVTTTYSVIGISGNCHLSSFVTVSVFPLPSFGLFTTTQINTICSGDTTDIHINGAITNTWSTNATTPTITISPSVTTTYSISAVDMNGCIGQDSIIITVNQSPSPTVTAFPSGTICSGQSVTLTATGADLYYWFSTANAQSSPLLLHNTVTLTLLTVRLNSM